MPTTTELKSTLRALADWHAAKAALGGPDAPMHSQAVLVALHIVACVLPPPWAELLQRAREATADLAAHASLSPPWAERAREATADHGARLLDATLTALRRTP